MGHFLFRLSVHLSGKKNWGWEGGARRNASVVNSKGPSGEVSPGNYLPCSLVCCVPISGSQGWTVDPLEVNLNRGELYQFRSGV